MNDDSISWHLGQFFGAYFHQDFDLEADDWQGWSISTSTTIQMPNT